MKCLSGIIFMYVVSVIMMSCQAGNSETSTREKPKAQFEVSGQYAETGEAINFSDISENDVQSRSWVFKGGTPSESSEKNPKVTYDKEGFYSVSLKVSNAYGKDEILKRKFIKITNPDNYKQTPMVNKFIATWCGFCGSWGWDLMDRFYNDFSDSALVVSVYNSNKDRHITTPVGQELQTGIYPEFKNFPTFLVNGSFPRVSSVEEGYNAVKDSIEASLDRSSKIYSMFYVDNNDTHWEVFSFSKVLEDLEGNFYLAAYIIEDKVTAPQVRKSDSASHKNVLRSAAGDKTFGNNIIDKSSQKGEVIENKFTAEIGSDWNTENIKVAVIAWKKNEESGKYEYINASYNAIE